VSTSQPLNSPTFEAASESSGSFAFLPGTFGHSAHAAAAAAAHAAHNQHAFQSVSPPAATQHNGLAPTHEDLALSGTSYSALDGIVSGNGGGGGGFATAPAAFTAAAALLDNGVETLYPSERPTGRDLGWDG
jgi:hypothetical protein